MTTEQPPEWLLERHGTLEDALHAADLVVVNLGSDVRAAHKDSQAAAQRLQEARDEFDHHDRLYIDLCYRLQNARRHRAWVESLLTAPVTP